MALARVNVSSGGRTPPITVNVPTQSGTLTYSGSVKTPTWNGYDATQLLIGGTTSATDAGTYTATFTPQGNVTWSDGTSSPKSVTWTIAKATPVLTTRVPTCSIAEPGSIVRFEVLSASDGTLSATSSNSNVATATVGGTTITVTGRGLGDANITASQAATTNYAAASIILTVTAPAIITDDWATISSRAKAGTAANYYKVGDMKKITLNGKIGDCLTLNNEELYVFILHINCPMNGQAENNIIWGGFKTTDGKGCVLCDSQYNKHLSDGTICFNMNHWDNTNYGGWKGTDLRYDILGATSTPPSDYGKAHTESNVGYDATAATLTNPKANTLLAALPSDFRNVLRLWSRWIDATGGYSEDNRAKPEGIKETIDAITLLAECELWHAQLWASSSEFPHMETMDYYYRLNNYRSKYRHDSTVELADYWLASPRRDHSAVFCSYAEGYTGGTASRHSMGLSPAFKV